MKKVVAFIGSPRKNGNTSTVIGEILRGAQAAGAETAVFDLYDLDIKPCMGCFTCRNEPTCSQHDAMAAIYEAIKKADAVVIGSPVYMRQVTGQTKTFFDRLFPLTEIMDTGFQPRFGTKKTIMVYSQGNPDPKAYATAFADNAGFMNSGGLDVVDTIVVAGNAVPKTEAFAIGQKIAQ
ncbi:MAG: NADPH-dependent reductase [Firmicutes bacterium]|nr:NADPH-dependent reductase [Bacillota bacterium]